MTGNNALVEGRNARVVRKWFGHDHIPQRFADTVNRSALATLSPFLNFHRPCLFATEYRDDKGKVRRKYRAKDVMTPYAKLKSPADAAQRVTAEHRDHFERIDTNMTTPADRSGAPPAPPSPGVRAC